MSSKNKIEQKRTPIQNRAVLEKTAQTGKLENISAQHLDLRAITLDGIICNNVDFRGANMTGANISEGRFTGCIFDEACLVDACLCESVFEDCSFALTRFGATDICYGTMNRCWFKGDSALSLNFIQLSALTACHYALDDETITFDKAPIAIHGLLNNTVTLIGEQVVLGGKAFPLSSLTPSIVQLILAGAHSKVCDE